MSYTRLEIETGDGIGRVWLNRPEKRNALDRTMVEELRTAVAQLESDADVRVIVLGGRGPAFCAGADLDYLRRMAEFTVLDNMEDSGRWRPP